MRWIVVLAACAGCYDPYLPPRDAVVDGDDEPPSDADPDPDAAPECDSECALGSCEGGVCVIDCTADGACRERVVCPEGVPCRVECGGAGSCADEVRCAIDQPCLVVCSGRDSCPKRTKCKDACACDVLCTGEDACDERAECPGDDDDCRLGNGCTSEPGECNRCAG